MEKTTLYVLIGIPGSGKSTYAKTIDASATIVSSDTIRKEMYGEESIQGNPADVFNRVRNTLEQEIKAGRNVIVDATSVSRKSRKTYIEIAKKHDCLVKAVFIDPSFGICLERNNARERVVPYDVMCRMARTLVPPAMDEGWDEIITKDGVDNFELTAIDPIRKIVLGDLSVFSELMDVSPSFALFRDMEQKSKWHQENLDTHIRMIMELIVKDHTVDTLERRKLLALALFHDISKPACRRKKFENQEQIGWEHLGNGNFRKQNGNTKFIDNWNDWQFLSHETVGKSEFDRHWRHICSSVFEAIGSSYEESLDISAEISTGILQHINYNGVVDSKTIEAFVHYDHAGRIPLA